MSKKSSKEYKEIGVYLCNECGERFEEHFSDETPHDFYPCHYCDEGEGKLTSTQSESC